MARPPTSKRPTTRSLTPAAAVDRLETLYGQATSALSTALDRYLETRKPPTPEQRAQFRYPLLRLSYRDDGAPRAATWRAFAKLQRPGVYETTITHPGPFRSRPDDVL